MELLIGLMIFVVLAWIVLKLFAVVFHVGIFVLTLPFKLLGLLLALLLTPLILLPLGLLGGIVSLIALPLVVLAPIVPLLLIGLGLWIILKNN